MDYLQTEEIGGIVSKGLAVLYLEKPRFPIDFLAKWLLTYSRNMKLQVTREAAAKLKREKQDQERVRLSQIEVLNQQWAEIVQRMEQKHIAFVDLIKATQFHDEFLRDQFCDYLATKYNLNVYVAEMDFPAKETNLLLEDDENSHLNLEGQKLLSYVYTSRGQEFLVRMQLAPETGVTYDIFKEPQPDDNGEVKPIRDIYIPNVVKEARIVYHKWPKLGAYYVVPLVYNSVLFEQAFDAGIEQRQTYLVNKEAQDKERAVKEAEFDDRLENEDPAVVEAERQTYLQGLEQIAEPALATTKKELVLCVDSLGQDRESEIPEQDRMQISTMAELVVKSWELQEVAALSKDIEKQIAYIQSQGPVKELQEQWQAEEEQYIEQNAEKLQEFKENERLLAYETECLRLEKLREKLQEKDFIGPLLGLSEYTFIKFSGVIQAALYLCNFDKAEINIPRTNRLNWRKVSKQWNEDLVQQIVSYNHRGPKPQPSFPWSMIDRIQKRVEKIEQELVDNYNFVLGRLLRFLVMTCKLRRLDIELRREAIAVKRKAIEQAKDEASKIQTLHDQLWKEALEQLTPEEQEEFNREEWEANFEIDHPMPEIGENPQDEIDDDYLFEIQQQQA